MPTPDAPTQHSDSPGNDAQRGTESGVPDAKGSTESGSPDAPGKTNDAGASDANKTPACMIANPVSCAPTSFVLATPNTYAVASVDSEAYGVAVADLNGDCKDDILVAQGGNPGEAFAVFLSKGDGTFGAETAVDFSGADDMSTTGSPRLVAVADLNGDGHPDLIGFPYLGISLGNGDGTFAPATVVPTSTQIDDGAQFLLTGDVFGDGLNDILLAEGGDTGNSGTIAIMRNAGGSTPSFAEVDWNFPLDSGTFAEYGLALADFNGDGKPDLAIAGSTNDGENTVNLWIVPNTGSGFGTPVEVAQIAGALAAADFDGDGKIDLAVATPSPPSGGTESTVSIILNQGGLKFGQPTSNMVQGNTVSAITAADLNGDGKPDLVTVDMSYEGGSLLMNQGGGTFGSASALPGTTLNSPEGVAAGDFLGNGTRGVAASLYNFSGYQLTTFAGKCL